MSTDRPRDPLWYEPRFTFDADDQAYKMEGPSAATIAADLLHAFNRDIDGKMRAALIDMGWMPPEDAARFRGAGAVSHAGLVLRSHHEARIAELEALLLTALALHGGVALTHSEIEWRSAARKALGLAKAV